MLYIKFLGKISGKIISASTRQNSNFNFLQTLKINIFIFCKITDGSIQDFI